MNMFPAVDPIPLPAPVWMFKALHIGTLALHFVAVEVLLGSLLVAVWLSFRGGTGAGDGLGALRLNAASTLARRLPVILTFVINLGVPPLLFAQVLYGRAFYTSSVLIGVYWIGVVFLLTACYWLVYRFAARAEAGRSAWLLGLAAWLLAGAIARVYSTNMTLMLRPEQWGQMYWATALGWRLPPADPTLGPRWLFMLSGGLVMGGLWMIWLSGRKHLAEAVRNYLATKGGRLAAVMVVAQALVAYQVFRAQPAAVRGGLTGTTLYQLAGLVWLGVAGLILALGLWCGWRKPAALGGSLPHGGVGQPFQAAGSDGFPAVSSQKSRETGKSPQPADKNVCPTTGTSGAGYFRVSWIAAALGLVAMLSAVVYRDGIRDLTLLSKGFDVWQRATATNWPVVALFLVVFVAGLAAAGWLISVMLRAKPVSGEGIEN
jgi:hypothetical protein